MPKTSKPKAAAKPKAVRKTKPAAGEFSVTLTVADKVYKATGASVIDCVEQFEPEHLKARGIFVVTHGDQTSTMTMYPMQIKKLIANQMFREIFQKRMLNALH